MSHTTSGTLTTAARATERERERERRKKEQHIGWAAYRFLACGCRCTPSRASLLAMRSPPSPPVICLYPSQCLAPRSSLLDPRSSILAPRSAISPLVQSYLTILIARFPRVARKRESRMMILYRRGAEPLRPYRCQLHSLRERGRMIRWWSPSRAKQRTRPARFQCLASEASERAIRDAPRAPFCLAM